MTGIPDQLQQKLQSPEPPRRVPPFGPETGMRIAQVVGVALGIIVVLAVGIAFGSHQFNSALHGIMLAMQVVILGTGLWIIIGRVRRWRRYRQRKDERLRRQGSIARYP